MPPAPASHAWVETVLKSSGLGSDAAQLSFEDLPGNPERIDCHTLRRQRVLHHTKPVALLISGPDLSELKRRSEIFNQALPAISCPVLAATRIGEDDLLLTEYFDGISALSALTEPAFGVKIVLDALARLADQRESAKQPSSRESAREELHQLFDRVMAVKAWTSCDRNLLSGLVFPAVEQALLSPPHFKRPTNGDLTLTNLLLDAKGNIRLVDYEQASLTHFGDEDWWRLTCWHAPRSVRDFALGRILVPQATRAYFALKQIAFENEVLHPTKARAGLHHWAAEIWRLLPDLQPDSTRSVFWPDRSNQDLPAKILAQSVQSQRRSMELFDYAQQLTELHNRQADKLQRMQDSFSWRCTAWLRALRRRFLDSRIQPPSPKNKPALASFPFALEEFPPAASPLIHFQLSKGPNQPLHAGETELTGWAFSETLPAICAVRARIGNRMFEGIYGLERDEITEKFLPSAWSGFSIKVIIEKADASLDLELGDGFGNWYTFHSCPVNRSSSSPGLPNQSTLLGNATRYENWVARHDTLSATMLEQLRSKAIKLPRHPLISLVMPVYNTEERWLRKVIESVQAQIYTRWELCIADDASTLPHIRPLLQDYAARDPRIKIVFRPSNGHISASSNSALELAEGEYTAFIDHDDEIPPHALYHVADVICRHPDAELIYTDEDKISVTGQRTQPHFKPDWNPDLLRSQNYICHLATYRTALLRELGGLRTGVEGSQDWDLALRASLRMNPANIHHIPRILYHWRAIEGSTALHLKTKDYTTKAACKALEDHLQATGQNASPRLVRGQHWHIRYAIPDPAPLVTLIIPTRNRPELLATCIESIRARTQYPNFEFLIADNDSDDPGLQAFYRKQESLGRFAVLPCPGPFNYSAINNRAVQAAHGELIGLLNNDLEAIHPEWLDEMVGHALRPEIGVVGAKLYYPDMSVQHAGVITGLGGVAGHAFKHFPRNDPGTPQFRPHLVQNLSAVTAACVVLRKSVFEEAGGLDAENLKVAFNDVDFCLRVQELGYRNVFTPFAELIHHESATRGAEDSPEKIGRFQKEIEYMKKRWGERLLNDPAYNPNLTLDTEDFAYAFPPRI